MTETAFQRPKDLPAGHLLSAGTPMCAGCGGLEAIHIAYDVLGENTIFVNAAGCMTLLSVYPFTPFRGSWLYTAMGAAPAGAQGVRDALDILMDKGRIDVAEDLEVVVLTGDGSGYGMGISATSGTIDRCLDYLYIIYDNEGYGNTGQQYSAATPHAARTATSRCAYGHKGFKKDLFSILAANGAAYVATAIGSDPLDLAQKIEKAKSISGPRFIITLAPCPTGWDFDPKETMTIGKEAVRTGIWPLKEFLDGKVFHTRTFSQLLPVESYLEKQGRFRHLFEPQKKKTVLRDIQNNIDRYWQKVPTD